MEERYNQTTKKKILFLITKSNFGGAQKYVHDLARCLPKNTHECTVISGGTGILIERLAAENIRTITLPTLARDVNIYKDIASFFKLFSILRNEKPDVFHINSSKAGGIGALAGRCAGVPSIIFTAHAWAFNEDRGYVSKKIIKILHWLTILLSHRTITFSDSVKNQMINTPFIKNKMIVVHPGIEKTNSLTKAEARSMLGIQNDIFAIGTIAELHPIKGLSYVLNALENISLPFSYTVIGEGELRNELEKLVKNNSRLSSTVSLKGFLKNAPNLLSAFDMFILPSLSEAFGYVLLEAGLAKLPVVATNVGGIPEIVKPGMGILVEPKNSSALQNAIEQVISNPRESNAMAEKLNKWVLDEFTIEKMVEKTIAVYENKI